MLKNLPKRIAVAFIGLTIVLSASKSLLFAKNPEHLLIAVMPFVYKAANQDFKGCESGLDNALTSELVKTKKFRVIERDRIDALLSESRFQQIGITDPKTQTEIGKQLNTKALVMGSITSVSIRDEFRSVKFAEKTTRWTEVEAEAKLVNVETGEMLASARAIGKSKTAEKHAFGGKTGDLAKKEEMLQKALQNLSEKLAKEMAKTYSAK